MERHREGASPQAEVPRARGRGGGSAEQPGVEAAGTERHGPPHAGSGLAERASMKRRHQREAPPPVSPPTSQLLRGSAGPRRPPTVTQHRFLKREISRKRQQLEDKELVGGNKKYFKRSELAKKEEEAYFQRCGYKVQQQEEEEKPLTSTNPVLELELAEEKLPMTLSRQEVIRRLRERGEPVRLFGETDYDAFQRLRKIEILAPEVNKGLRNDLKAALDKIDQQYLNEIVGGQEAGDDDSQNDLKVHEENTTIEELEALGESLGRGDDHYDMDIITKFLKFLLGVWAKELNAREDYVKRGVQGKLNSATQKQTESYLRPLFRKLRKRTLPADIKESITDIIKFMLQREYVKANDAYLQMAIGNAPWPIGVTMVGIHARTGREKIFSKHVAHVLNDETQRKYIQGLKRLMTICQKHFPTDPSKCVEYNAL